MIFIKYVCVASRWFILQGIHTADTIFFVTWGRGEGKTLSRHVVSTQCAEGLNVLEKIIVSAGSSRLYVGSYFSFAIRDMGITKLVI